MKRPDISIDKAIMKTLNKEGTCSYRELKRKVDTEVMNERTMKGRVGTIPSETFFRHLMRLVRNNFVKREEELGSPRTSRVNYSISTEIDYTEYK